MTVDEPRRFKKIRVFVKSKQCPDAFILNPEAVLPKVLDYLDRQPWGRQFTFDQMVAEAVPENAHDKETLERVATILHERYGCPNLTVS
jgi:hypothetical protein